jgi:hypothetical protein
MWRTALVSALMACSPSSPAPVEKPQVTTRTLSMSLVVKAGDEQHRCQFMKLPAGEAAVVAWRHHFSAGSHHFIVYRTDLKTMPAGGEQAVDCYAEGDTMKHVRGVLYGDQISEGKLQYPDGVGVQIASEEIVMFQAHYINTSKSDLNAKIDVEIDTVSASAIKEEAGTLGFYEQVIYLPAKSTARAGMRCPVSERTTILSAFPHMHRRGVKFAAWIDRDAKATGGTPFYTSADWEHPTTFKGPLVVEAGSYIRFECQYDNPDDKEVFMGVSATENEMCILAGAYLPRQTLGFEYCLDGEQFAAGSTTCTGSWECIKGCSGTAALSNWQCFQKCTAAACAAGPITKLNDCIDASCASECSSRNAASCTPCVEAKCAMQLGSCTAQKC